MEVESIKLMKPWDGRGVILLVQSDGFYCTEKRYLGGSHFITDDYAIVFTKDVKDKKKLLEMMKLLTEDIAATREEDCGCFMDGKDCILRSCACREHHKKELEFA